MNSLRVHDYIGDKTDTSMSLPNVYNVFFKLSRQVPASHLDHARRIEFLRWVFIGYDWSREPLSRVATNGLTLQQLYGEL